MHNVLLRATCRKAISYVHVYVCIPVCICDTYMYMLYVYNTSTHIVCVQIGIVYMSGYCVVGWKCVHVFYMCCIITSLIRMW